jgi:hypothetical protein
MTTEPMSHPPAARQDPAALARLQSVRAIHLNGLMDEFEMAVVKRATVDDCIVADPIARPPPSSR